MRRTSESFLSRQFRATISSSALLDRWKSLTQPTNRYADGLCKTVNVKNTRAGIASLLEKYRSSPHKGANIVHVLQQTPEGAPVFTPNTPLAEEFAELKPKDGEHVIVSLA
jgi:hypothetical protein